MKTESMAGAGLQESRKLGHSQTALVSPDRKSQATGAVAASGEASGMLCR